MLLRIHFHFTFKTRIERAALPLETRSFVMNEYL